MKILAIDYGVRNIGLAISDGFLAEPLGQIKIKGQKDFLTKIEKLCLKNKIKKIILGLPDGRLHSVIKKIKTQLKKRLNLDVILYDETLTTKEAILKMKEAGKKRKERQKKDHLFAACLILQSYLDERV